MLCYKLWKSYYIISIFFSLLVLLVVLTPWKIIYFLWENPRSMVKGFFFRPSNLDWLAIEYQVLDTPYEVFCLQQLISWNHVISSASEGTFSNSSNEFSLFFDDEIQNLMLVGTLACGQCVDAYFADTQMPTKHMPSHSYLRPCLSSLPCHRVSCDWLINSTWWYLQWIYIKY